MERMGCASCPAHKNWEIRLAKDPTSEGLGMLRQNLKLLKEYEPLRLVDSVNVLKKYIKNPKNELSEKSTERVGSIIKEFE